MSAPVAVPDGATPDGAAAGLFKNIGYSCFDYGAGILLDSGVCGACFLVSGIGNVFFFFSGDASFFKVAAGSGKADIVVPCFEIFTLVPTCEFIVFKLSS